MVSCGYECVCRHIHKMNAMSMNVKWSEGNQKREKKYLQNQGEKCRIDRCIKYSSQVLSTPKSLTFIRKWMSSNHFQSILIINEQTQKKEEKNPDVKMVTITLSISQALMYIDQNQCRLSLVMTHDWSDMPPTATHFAFRNWSHFRMPIKQHQSGRECVCCFTARAKKKNKMNKIENRAEMNKL